MLFGSSSVLQVSLPVSCFFPLPQLRPLAAWPFLGQWLCCMWLAHLVQHMQHVESNRAFEMQRSFHSWFGSVTVWFCRHVFSQNEDCQLSSLPISHDKSLPFFVLGLACYRLLGSQRCSCSKKSLGSLSLSSGHIYFHLLLLGYRISPGDFKAWRWQEPILLHENSKRFPSWLLQRFLGHLYHIEETVAEAADFGQPARRERKLTRLVHRGKCGVPVPFDNFAARFYRSCEMTFREYYWQHLIPEAQALGFRMR